MYLLHNTDQNSLHKILDDGVLKVSSDTKNVKLYGQPTGSKYIFLRLPKDGDSATIYLDYKLLLDCVFYLNIGWHGGITDDSIKVDGKTLNEKSLKKILDDFSNKVSKYQKEFLQAKGINVPMISNEILVRKRIPLNKYLLKINTAYVDSKVKVLLKKYEQVKIIG
jgi:hypothetical protein